MIKTTSEKLRWLVSQHETIVAIYTSLKCEQCINLLPKLKVVVSNKVYANILFVEIEIIKNSIIEKEIEKNIVPI